MSILSPVVTPFDADLKPDAERLAKHCKWLISNDVGLAVFGTNSEANSLSLAEKLHLLEALVEAGLCSEEDVAKALASQFDMEYIDLDAPETESRIDLALVPEELAKKHLILPLGKSGGRLKLAISDPMDLELLDLLRFRLNTEIETAIAPKSSIKNFIDGATSTGGSGHSLPSV